MDRIGRVPEIRRHPTLSRHLDHVARSCLPTACTLALMLLCALPLGFPEQAELLPATVLCCVWFWSLFRPASMPPAVVFVLGVLFDLLGYLPLGVGVLMLLLAHGVAVLGRRWLLRQGFASVWLVFASVAALATGVGWALTSLLLWRLMPADAALFEFALCIALYPALAVLFGRAHRSVADPERA
jgi:rod shape-determining protein MreD